MTPSLSVPDPKVALTLAELSTIQSIAAAHLTFSLTLACPLRCAHCIVDASPLRGDTTMPLATARHYADQMPDLAAYGIRSLSFTGGEPLLAQRQLETIANAAHQAGITTGIVTAAHWAVSPEVAARTVKRHAAIDSWDISVDAYHLEFVPLERVRFAYQALRDQGKRATLRFTYTDPPAPPEQEILEFISSLEGAEFAAQKVRSVGRGTELEVTSSHVHNPWVKPCLTQGMVIRYDGSIGPCCLNLVESRAHPFQLGDARSLPLRELHQQYLAQPLLQLIRAVGFTELRTWLEDARLYDQLPQPLPDEVCEICTLIMHNPELSSYLNRRAQEPLNRLKIALIVRHALGEDQMLRSVLADPDIVSAFPEEVSVISPLLTAGPGSVPGASLQA